MDRTFVALILTADVNVSFLAVDILVIESVIERLRWVNSLRIVWVNDRSLNLLDRTETANWALSFEPLFLQSIDSVSFLAEDACYFLNLERSRRVISVWVKRFVECAPSSGENSRELLFALIVYSCNRLIHFFPCRLRLSNLFGSPTNKLRD